MTEITSLPPTGDAVRTRHPAPSALSSQPRACRYFASPSGCRAGNACQFKHEAASGASAASHANAALPDTRVQRSIPDRTRAAVPPSKVVKPPIPAAQLENPREFELGQIKRRFNPKETCKAGSTALSFKLAPSDPDFPFEIQALDCVLTVDRDYPEHSRPSLRILNKDIPRGFQINIEQGFDEIAAENTTATLLGLVNRLDKALADILSRPQAETIKLYRPVGVEAKPKAAPEAKAISSAPRPAPAPAAPVWTDAQKSEAATRRQADLRQLNARLGKSPGFAQSQDGVTFTLPPSVYQTRKAPPLITQATSLKLIVPELYPLIGCRIQFQGPHTDEAANIEKAFEARGQTQKDATILAQVNFLSLHLAPWSVATAPKETAAPVPAPVDAQPIPTKEKPDDEWVVLKSAPTDKPHVHVIPRPIEWSHPRAEGDESSSGSESYETDFDSDSDEDDEDEATTEHDTPARATTSVAERGILLCFPNLELHGIELLEMTMLNLTVKCNRCKETSDFERLRNNVNADHTGMKEQGCKKCASSLAAGYRMDMIHANSSRAGYIDLDGCTAVDMLPSTFVPTCSECSTAYTTPGCVSVRGDSTLAICRECHRKMSFRIPEVKFLMVSAAAERATQGPVRKTVKENLGIVAGTELPRRGKCQHYSKSYRWFRFSCCSKVYPCDRCHALAAPDHPVEFANRMICGYCSREQNYRPEDCGVCRQSLIGRKGHGFWEGGKGTRDPMRMSRKDPRKYKRRPGVPKNVKAHKEK